MTVNQIVFSRTQELNSTSEQYQNIDRHRSLREHYDNNTDEKEQKDGGYAKQTAAFAGMRGGALKADMSK